MRSSSFLQLGDLLLRHEAASTRSSNSRGFAGAAAGAYEEALTCYLEAVRRYRQAREYDPAVSVLLKMAEMREAELSSLALQEAARCYEEALEIRTSQKLLVHTSEVYRHYICMLVRTEQLQQAAAVSLRRAKCLLDLKRFPAVHKAILSAALLFLAIDNQPMADRILSSKEVRSLVSPNG